MFTHCQLEQVAKRQKYNCGGKEEEEEEEDESSAEAERVAVDLIERI
jgi:hypothetical protein